MTQIVT
jgi:GTPase SAR1 family protein